MKGDRIRYRSGYKYQLVNDYRVQLKFVRPEVNILTEFIEFDVTGYLFIKHGYAWDGPSNPIYRFLPNFILKFLLKHFMRGSLVHDVLAQLCRDGYLSCDKCYTFMNKELEEICLEDGMTKARASVVFFFVENSGGAWAKLGSDGGKPLFEAP